MYVIYRYMYLKKKQPVNPCIYYHHHVVLLTRISMTLSHHSSLSPIAPAVPLDCILFRYGAVVDRF